LHYTNNVFISECGFSDLFNEEELSNALNISYTNLSSISEDNFLAFLTQQKINEKDKNSISTQITEDDFYYLNNSFDNNNKNSQNFSTSKSIEKKFREIDEKYQKIASNNFDPNSNNNDPKNISNAKNLFDCLMPAKSLEEKMLKYSRELEAKYKTDLDREILHLKEIELSSIRIEENKKYLKKLEEIRNEYEEEYTQKYENFRKRESDFSLKISNKEKEMEINQFETRQKYLNQIETLKLKQEELKIKYENDLNLLYIKEEKVNIKEKDLNDLREKSAKKIQDEIENFKNDFIKNFEKEKAELHKNKLHLEEIQMKANLKNEEFLRLENSNKNFIEENKLFKEDIKKLEILNREYKSDLNSLRDELRILAGNEKRNSDITNLKLTENESLKTENKILKENIFTLKQINEDRKSDQGIIIDDLRNQIKENTKQFNKLKEDLENENMKLRKEINALEMNKGKNMITLGKNNKIFFLLF